MAISEQAAKIKVAVEDIEIVDDAATYLKISSPAIVESVRALRKAAGLDGKGTTGPSFGVTG
jgi:hypothetical protein